MFDASVTSPTLGSTLYCLIFYLVLVFINFDALWYQSRADWQYQAKRRSLVFLFIIFAVTAFISGDFFHYQDLVTSGRDSHLEEIYYFIIRAVNNNYLYFRIIVWGTATILTVTVFKRFSDNYYFALLFVLLAYYLTFSYARATLAMSVFFLGLSFWCKPIENHGILSFLAGALFIGSSYFFHHSMLVPICFSFLVLLPARNKWLYFTIILYPLLVFLMNRYFLTFLNDILTENEVQQRALLHLDSAMELKANWKGVIGMFIDYSVFYLPILILSKYILADKAEIPSYLYKLYFFTFNLILVATSFLLIDLESKVFFYRILFMSFIPLTVLCTEFYRMQIGNPSTYRFLWLWCIFSTIYKMIYEVYEQITSAQAIYY